MVRVSWFGIWAGANVSPRDGGGTPGGRPTRARESLEPIAPDHPDERALVVRIAAGDERAFEALVTGYAPALTRFAYDFSRARDVAEDVVNDVFVWIWEHRADWRVRGSVRAYLFSAVRHRAMNARRNASFRDRWSARHGGDRAAAGMGQGGDADLVRALEVRELGAQLRRAIDRLSDGRRTAVLLRWVYGMSYAEIAQATGTSVIGVKQQLNRALKDLRAALPDALR